MEGLIQIVILVCLLIIIVLLAIDKVQIVKSDRGKEQKPVSSKLPDIMGKTDMVNHSLPKGKVERRLMMSPEIDKIGQPEKIMNHLVNTVRIKEVPSNPTEDENLSEDDFLSFNDKFSQGVSVEELMTVGMLLQQNDLEFGQEKAVFDVVQKIQGTELYGLLEHSIGDASKKIARLLDSTLKINESSGDDPQGRFDKFNIDDFI